LSNKLAVRINYYNFFVELIINHLYYLV